MQRKIDGTGKTVMLPKFEMLLNHDKRLPKEFIEIQVLYEKILENLEVNGEKITVK